LVQATDRVYRCRLRGRLKQGPQQVQTVAVIGDRVRFRPVPRDDSSPPTGVIEEVLPRHNKISRRAARRSGGRVEQVLMANLDQVAVVQSLLDPAPQPGFVDRLLLAAARFGVAGLLCLNKCDLDPEGAADNRWDYYRKIGYEVVRTSVKTRLGLSSLEAHLRAKISLLLGASGVGKSALLNAIQPGLNLRIAPVGHKSGLGRHTTSRSELFALACGGFIADSPGLRGFEPWDLPPAEVCEHFPDWQQPAADCRFRSCLHRDEPDCGVKAAVARSEIPAWRYRAYLDLLRDVEGRRGRVS
jgi:ribosome biogenesis GTPase